MGSLALLSVWRVQNDAGSLPGYYIRWRTFDLVDGPDRDIDGNTCDLSCERRGKEQRCIGYVFHQWKLLQHRIFFHSL